MAKLEEGANEKKKNKRGQNKALKQEGI